MNQTIKNTKIQDSVDFFQDEIRTKIHKALIFAHRKNDDFSNGVSYNPFEQKFDTFLRIKNTWDNCMNSVEIKVNPWHLTDDGNELSIEEYNEMTDEEIVRVIDDLSSEWVEQYEHDIDDAEAEIKKMMRKSLKKPDMEIEN